MPSNDPTDALNLVNAGYVADLYDRYRSDPASVDPEWRSLFDSGAGGFEPVEVADEQTNGSVQAPDKPSQQPTPGEATPPTATATETPTPPATAPEGATPIKGPAARLAQN